MAGTLPTKPPRQLSRLGTNPGIDRKFNTTKPDKQANSVHVYICIHVHVNKAKQGKANGSTQGRQMYMYVYMIVHDQQYVSTPQVRQR